MGQCSDFIDGLKSCNWVLWSKFLGFISAGLLLGLGGFLLFGSVLTNGTAWWSVICGIFVVIGKTMDSYFVRSGMYTTLFALGIIFYVKVSSEVGCLISFIFLELCAICYFVVAFKERANREPTTAGGQGDTTNLAKADSAKESSAKKSFASSLFSAAAENPETTKKMAGAAMKYAEENPDEAKQLASTAYSYGQQNPDWAKGIAQTGGAYGQSNDANPFAV